MELIRHSIAEMTLATYTQLVEEGKREILQSLRPWWPEEKVA
jgi:hypothetical protein